MSRPVAFEDRFWSKVDQSGECWVWTARCFSDGYGQFRLNGTQVRTHRLSVEMAAGMSLEKGQQCLHTCDTRRCVRNDDEGIYVVNGIARPRFGHLWIGTHQDNMRDKCQKGRQPRGDTHYFRLHPEAVVRGDRHPSRLHPENLLRGENHPYRLHPELVARGERGGNAKLTNAAVIEARRLVLEGWTHRALVDRYGVARQVMSAAINGLTWRHLPGALRYSQIVLPATPKSRSDAAV